MNKDKEYKGTIINMDPKENKKVMIRVDGRTKEQLIRISGLTIIKEEEKVEEEKVEEEKVEEEQVEGKVEEEKVKEEQVEGKVEEDKVDGDKKEKEKDVEEDKDPDKKEEKSQKIEIGSKVKWEDKGKLLTGTVEKETASNYKICCKPGKISGDKGSVYQVSKDKVELE